MLFVQVDPIAQRGLVGQQGPPGAPQATHSVPLHCAPETQVSATLGLQAAPAPQPQVPLLQLSLRPAQAGSVPQRHIPPSQPVARAGLLGGNRSGLEEAPDLPIGQRDALDLALAEQGQEAAHGNLDRPRRYQPALDGKKHGEGDEEEAQMPSLWARSSRW